MSKTFYLVVSVGQINELAREAKRSAKLNRKGPAHCIVRTLEEMPGFTALDGSEQIDGFSEAVHNLKQSNDEFAAILKEGGAR